MRTVPAGIVLVFGTFCLIVRSIWLPSPRVRASLVGRSTVRLLGACHSTLADRSCSVAWSTWLKMERDGVGVGDSCRISAEPHEARSKAKPKSAATQTTYLRMSPPEVPCRTLSIPRQEQNWQGQA